jgi:hypothetical protein
MQTVGQERDEDMGLDALLKLVINGAQGQIGLKIFEGFLHLTQLHIKLPKVSLFIGVSNIGAQQVTSFSAADFAEFVPVQTEAKALLVDRLIKSRPADVNQFEGLPCELLGLPQLEQQGISLEFFDLG